MSYFVISPIFPLVFGFVFTIVLQAWFVRRMSHLRGSLKERKREYDRLHAEATALGQTVSEFKHGKESNSVSVQALEREIEELREKVDLFLEAHPELKAQYEEKKAETDAVAEEQSHDG